MLKRFLLPLLLSICMLMSTKTQAQAQFPKIPRFKQKYIPLDSVYSQSRKLYNWDRSMDNVKQSTQEKNKVIMGLDSLPKAELVGRNQNFDIFRLPIDKMICLLPNADFTDKMNLYGDKPDNEKVNNLTADKMPNAIPKTNWIPSK